MIRYGAILLLAFANLVVRYASSRYPSVENSNMRSKLASNKGENLTAPAPQPAQEVHYS